jgi:hypothetical protein
MPSCCAGPQAIGDCGRCEIIVVLYKRSHNATQSIYGDMIFGG